MNFFLFQRNFSLSAFKNENVQSFQNNCPLKMKFTCQIIHHFYCHNSSKKFSVFISSQYQSFQTLSAGNYFLYVWNLGAHIGIYYLLIC